LQAGLIKPAGMPLLPMIVTSPERLKGRVPHRRQEGLSPGSSLNQDDGGHGKADAHPLTSG